MTSWEAIIVAFLAAIPGILAFVRQFRQDSHQQKFDLIEKLEGRIEALEEDLECERQERRKLEAALDTERKKRLAAEAKVAELARRLQDATEARVDRIQRIQELEAEVKRLQQQVADLESKNGN